MKDKCNQLSSDTFSRDIINQDDGSVEVKLLTFRLTNNSYQMSNCCYTLFERSGLQESWYAPNELTEQFEGWLECRINQDWSLFTAAIGVEYRYWKSFNCSPEHLTYLMLKGPVDLNNC